MFKRIIVIAICLSIGTVALAQSDLDIVNIFGGSEELVNFRKVDEGERISFDVVSPSSHPIKILNRPRGATFIENTFTWTPSATQAGIYEIHFSILASGGENGEMTYKTVIIIVANTRFVIAENRWFRRLFTATDPDNDRVEISINNLPIGATLTGGRYGPKLFSWIPTRRQKGRHPMTVVATDYPVNGEPKTDISYMVIIVAKKTNSTPNKKFNKVTKTEVIQFMMASMLADEWLIEESLL